MSNRLGWLLICLTISAGVALAAGNAAIIRVTRIEGEPAEFTFNPKEVAIDKAVPWAKAPTSKGDEPDLEFTSSDGRSVQFELEFDGVAAKEDVYTKYIKPLEALTITDPDTKRPPMVSFVWGQDVSFKGVVSNMSTKYTMFLPDGTPVRATTSLTIKSASKTSTKSDNDPPR